ncbi:MAG: hypothetical protein OXC19_18215 [Bryobacterales bacterium]|nr:hypothetical protein [Bryobacterales bacterium]
MFTFYVFHDNATSRARIHEGQCDHCNRGRGVTRPDLPPNPALWSGHFDTIEAAERVMVAFAAHKKNPDVGYCAACKWTLQAGEEPLIPRPGPR